jgi:putative colanic acid biosynthesis UDP-glucose lipid carrier transferase
MFEHAIVTYKLPDTMLPMPDTMSVLTGHTGFATKLKLTDARQLVRASQSKRVFDIVFALLVTVALLSWLVPIIAVLIKLESKGPVFFKQLRTGKDGRAFYCFKFRSMRVNADSDTKQASRGDARVTKVGAYLRKTSLDELPQFFNVLFGEMSIVGPRPHMLSHTEEYSRAIHNFMDRHAGMPGITGLAQVSGYRGETKELSAMSKRVNADIYYLQNQTFWLDVKIVLLTVRQALTKNEHVF